MIINRNTNPVSVPPTINSTNTKQQQASTGTNSNIFASVISQLLTEMEMQPSDANSDSSMGSFLPELAMLMNPSSASSLYGLDASANPSDPESLTSLGPLSQTDSTNDPFSLESSALDPLSQTDSTNDPNSLESSILGQIGQTAPASYNQNVTDLLSAPLTFQSINPNTLNQVLAGKLSGMGETFVRAGQQYNVNPALLTAIAQHETGNGSSLAAYQKNNIAGMMGSNGLKSYPTVEASIMDMASNLSKNYIGQGLTSISQIGAKYAPVGAQNDPTGLNNNWVKGVSGFFDHLTV